MAVMPGDAERELLPEWPAAGRRFPSSAAQPNFAPTDETRVLVVDDEPANTTLLTELLRTWGYSEVHATNDPDEVVALCAEIQPDLVVLDLHMPQLDGFGVMGLLRPWTSGRTRLPILAITADLSPETKRRALASGAQDVLNKPFDSEEVRLRVANLLTARRLQEELTRHSELLEQRVRERTREAEAARIEILQRLATAAEYRDDDTGQHTRRVARTAGMLAAELGLAVGTVRTVTLAAPLHDVGKIAIPDAVLLKPGQLTADELDLMKDHVQRGAGILGGSSSPLLQMAEEIALTHHERWDGGGYPAGLAQDQIPLGGRLVAVADVFDAMTHERPYKPAQPVQAAVEEICSQANRQFDPQVVEAFAGLDHETLLEPFALQTGCDDASESRGETSAGNRQLHRRRETAQPESEATAAEAPTAAASATVTLSDAAAALDVSPSTLRRWADTGRIAAVRTAGGHRRFAASEVRRLRSAGMLHEPPPVSAVTPPTQPLPVVARLLTAAGQELSEHAAKGIYGGRTGWWALETAQAQIEVWIQAVSGALLSGDYNVALAATRRLVQQAELAGTSQLERHAFLERFCDLAVRRLSREPGARHVDASGLRRLFACLRQLLLDDRASAPAAG